MDKIKVLDNDDDTLAMIRQGEDIVLEMDFANGEVRLCWSRRGDLQALLRFFREGTVFIEARLLEKGGA